MASLTINSLNPGLSALNVISYAIVIIGILVVDEGTITSTQMAAAQSTDNNSNATSLGNPFL